MKNFFTYYKLNNEEKWKMVKNASKEKPVDQNSVEKPVDQNSIEKSVDQNSVEKSAYQNSIEKSVDQNSVEKPINQNNEEKPFIFKADIKPRGFKRNKILIILSIIFLIYVPLVSIPVKKYVWTDTYLDYDFTTVFYHPILDLGGSILIHWSDGEWEYIYWFVLTMIAIGILPLVIYFIICAVDKAAAQKCSLYLTNKEIGGTRKHTPFSFTIDKIDNVYVVNSLFNKIRGGKTVVISAESRVVKISWVQNADEFVKKIGEVPGFKGNEEKPFICKADIKPSFKQNKILIILSIISLVYIALVSIPVRKETLSWGDVYYAILSFGEWIGTRDYDWNDGALMYEKFWVLTLIGIGIIPLTIYFIICAVDKAAAQKCSLYLTDKEINYTIKYIPFSVTIDKIRNVYAVNNKLRGGKTVVISAASGVIKFPWVQNADEFVKKAGEVIQESKRSSSC